MTFGQNGFDFFFWQKRAQNRDNENYHGQQNQNLYDVVNKITYDFKKACFGGDK